MRSFYIFALTTHNVSLREEKKKSVMCDRVEYSTNLISSSARRMERKTWKYCCWPSLNCCESNIEDVRWKNLKKHGEKRWQQMQWISMIFSLRFNAPCVTKLISCLGLANAPLCSSSRQIFVRSFREIGSVVVKVSWPVKMFATQNREKSVIWINIREEKK